jgi:fatty acid desaturase
MAKLNRQQLEEYHSLEHRYLSRIIVFAILYSVAGLMVLFLQSFNWSFGLCTLLSVPLYLLAAGSLHGISLFTHEGVHDLISQNSLGNRILSAVCAWPVLQNFSAYRVLHLRHHNNLAELHDPDHYHNYATSSGMVFLLHWGRLIFGYPVYITAIPLLGFWYASNRERISIVLEVIAVVLFVVSMFSMVPFEKLLHLWIIPMGIIHFMVNIRGMSQHTLLEDAQDQIKGTRSILTNPVTAFFMCNENYHLEHHLYPKVPWYHLPKVHRVLGDELKTLGAPYIPSYVHFVKDFVLASVQRKNIRTVSIDALHDS